MAILPPLFILKEKVVNDQKEEKRKITFKKIGIPPILYEDTSINISPYVSLANKSILMQNYVDIMFEDSDLSMVDRYLQAEYALILGTIDLCTDIEISEDINEIFESGIWEKIKPHIRNYDEFKLDIEKVMSIMREDVALEKSIGTTFDNLAVWIYGFLENISELDLSEAGITRLLQSYASEAERLDKIIPVVKQEEPKKRGRPKKVKLEGEDK